MVNVPGRSRGCATCRKRKVKCDESLPQCQRCLGMGLQCPGPRTASFYVHAVKSSTPASNEVVLPPRLPGPPPSRASAFDQLFVSHFIDAFFGPMKPPKAPGTPEKIWLHELPVFLASPEPTLAKHAIRAASMISYGSLTADSSIKTEARRWYAQALQDMHRQLSRRSNSSSESAVCAATMLIHFETWAGTSRRAWIQHIKGATTLLQAAGPESCRGGFLHQIFSHLRFQTLIAALAENEVPAFASPDWMTVPFEIYPKLIFERLTDVLFAVQVCLCLAHQLIRSEDDMTQLRAILDASIRDTARQLDHWNSSFAADEAFGAAHFTLPSPPDSEKSAMPFTSVPATALYSLYDAASIIMLRLQLLTTAPQASDTDRVLQHANNILSATTFVNSTTGIGPDRGSTMMVLQLKIVSLWSPSLQQRAMAADMLQDQKVQGGGLADISAVSHDFSADVASYVLQNFTND